MVKEFAYPGIDLFSAVVPDKPKRAHDSFSLGARRGSPAMCAIQVAGLWGRGACWEALHSEIRRIDTLRRHRHQARARPILRGPHRYREPIGLLFRT